ncbi:MAG: preprotein translocase subunit SecA [Planctomycetota bacterium]|jgi:preprotein translocase subunit SecA
MIGKTLQLIFGRRNDRIVKSVLPLVEQVNALEPSTEALDDEALKAKTEEFRARFADGETLDDMLPEAFAVCREASKRTLGQRPYDVQLIGGWALHRGMIAEMVTGEGKTLVGTLAVYLNAIPGRGVHLVTVNDYLARRDADWMRPVYEALGMTVGAIQANMDSEERIRQYECDITYGTNSEFGFDYLRDNMKVRKESQAQKGLVYAVVDEVDSILIDEARTPLIISGPAEDDRAKYEEADAVARRLRPGEDFEIKLKEHQCVLTEEGQEKAEKLAGTSFYEGGISDWPHLLEQALRAHHIYGRDKDYVVKEGEIIIVDEFTGRLMEGRRWSDGLHQAVEAKEGIRPRPENQTLATITYQNFFKLYDKIAGMTGTAATEAAEFWKIYQLDVLSIPTNRPLIRIEQDDMIFRTEKEKFGAVIDEILHVHQTGRPILVGTTSIEKSERVSGMLGRRGVEHVVLNAKQHEREGHIGAEAGQAGRVTIATNMAGRGTDIVLGEGVAESGGLHIIGTERHESRRIDNQLRGRAGRQGDPGSSQFFLSLEDDLMRIFAPEWVSGFLGKMGMGDGEAITHPMVSRAITRAQKKVEARNFEIRKNLLEYDEVMDIQRKEVYGLRATLLDEDLEHQKEIIADFFDVVVDEHVEEHLGQDVPVDARDPEELAAWFRRHFGVDCDAAALDPQDLDATRQTLGEVLRAAWARREQEEGEDAMRLVERFLLLNSIDAKWKDHLHAMDGLKTGIGLRGYAQVDPKVAYKIEGHRMFGEMLSSIRHEVTDMLFKVRLDRSVERDLQRRWSGAEAHAPESHGTGVDVGGPTLQAPPADGEGPPPGATGPVEPIRRKSPKVGRNDPCPCGSGRKYKKCHGAAA